MPILVIIRTPYHLGGILRGARLQKKLEKNRKALGRDDSGLGWDFISKTHLNLIGSVT